MSCAVWSFFRSQVRDVPPPLNGSMLKPPDPDTCALTSENVTSSAFASLYGESLIITLSVEPVLDGLDGEPHPAKAIASVTSTARLKAPATDINDVLQGP